MALPVWPTSLPKPRAAGFAREMQDPYQEFATDKQGASRRRRTTTRMFQMQDHPMRLTRTQYLALVAFCEDDCGGGVLHFDFIDDLTGNTIEAQFATSGAPKANGDANVPRLNVMVRLKVWTS